jgi:hypothetical protein
MSFANSGGPFTAEFDDKIACESVAAEWLKGAIWRQSRVPDVLMNVSPEILHVICVPKGSR